MFVWGALGVDSVGFSGLPVWFPRRQLGSSGAAFAPGLAACLPGELSPPLGPEPPQKLPHLHSGTEMEGSSHVAAFR